MTTNEPHDRRDQSVEPPVEASTAEPPLEGQPPAEGQTDEPAGPDEESEAEEESSVEPPVEEQPDERLPDATDELLVASPAGATDAMSTALATEPTVDTTTELATPTAPEPSPDRPTEPTEPTTPAPTLPRLRRPSGERPPLPYHLGRTGRLAIVIGLAAAAAWLADAIVFGESSWLARTDGALEQAIVDGRSDFAVDVAEAIVVLARTEAVYVLAALTIIGLLVFRRFRRLLTLAAVLLVVMVVTVLVQRGLARPRPYDVEILGRWEGYDAWSAGRAYLGVIAVGAVLCFAPPGRPRAWAAVGATVVLVAEILAAALLGTDYPIAALAGVTFAVATSALAFRLFSPDDAFPVVYRRSGRSAHLDLGGARGEAIRRAIERQLGFEVAAVAPFGQAGSAGSTPMKVTMSGTPERELFAKLYAQQHVRADRFYKLGRALLYGRLEDERAFRTVSRMAQSEDYFMRLFRDAGAPVVETFGVVELTPERELLLVTDFAAGAREVGDPEVVVDDAVIDDGLRAVRTLWDAGLAHRDLKPANVLVRDGRIILIDVGFAQLRPSPWRQAVDLANMMLCLAVRTDADRVYDRAVRQFHPSDIAEAFAATRGVTIPTQLHEMLKADGRDLPADFRRLAPNRELVGIQRWTPRRLVLTAGAVAFVVAAAAAGFFVFFGYNESEVSAPICPDDGAVLLLGQAVPQAESVPCLDPSIEAIVESTTVDEDGATIRAVVADATASLHFAHECSDDDTSSVLDVEGGCVELSGDASVDVQSLVDDGLIMLVSRSDLNATVRDRTGGWADTLTDSGG